MTLFRKEFMPLPKPLGLLSGLLTAMIEKCLRETGLFISFIEYSKLSIALGTCTKNKLSCIIVYDQPDGQEFGQILVQEILYNFIRVSC